MIIIHLAIRALMLHSRLAVAMALAVGVPLMSFFSLNGLQTGLELRYSTQQSDYLVVQSSGSFGEFYGSRLPASVAAEMLATQVSQVIPEIHTVVGSTYDDAILLRGIPLDEYDRLIEFRMLAGRPLLVGDEPRLVMLGSRLAEARRLLPGERMQLRGRDFTVVGIFETHTYAGNEAWISLQDAQALMGWGTDVSTYLIPSGETLKAGDTLPGGISVVRRGSSDTSLLEVWRPVFQLLNLVALTLGVAAAVNLASILWRMAWLQRRSLAILRSIGFGKANLVAYFLTQASAVSLFGFIAGGLGALALAQFTQITAAGISIKAVFDAPLILSSLLFTAGITLAGAIVPVFWLNRVNLVELLRSE